MVIQSDIYINNHVVYLRCIRVCIHVYAVFVRSTTNFPCIYQPYCPHCKVKIKLIHTDSSTRCSMMQSPQPDSQVETHLVDLLDFDKFALIKMLVQDRLKVVWCMRLNRAQNDEEHTRIQVICCTITSL